MASDKKISLGNTFIAGIWKENPVFALLLGMCPTLAVTTSLAAALTMGASVLFVLICSNIVISMMRNLLKPHLRILMFTLTISTFVTIADLALKAYLPDMSAKLGPFIPLIIVNCLIICRAEACASKNGIVVSITDAIGNGIGFTLTLSVLASIRELLATGEILGFTILPVLDLANPEKGGWYTPWGAMALPVGAFVTLGLLLGVVNLINRKTA
jgi:Na+-translocating ferredoxin:NAD+ oxidoreductase subunit E